MEQRTQELFVACFQGLMERVVCLYLAARIPDAALSAHPGNRAVAEAASPVQLPGWRAGCTCVHWYCLAPPSWTSG